MNIKMRTESIEEIKSLMYKASEMCQEDDERGRERGSRSHEDIMEHVRSALWHLKQFVEEGQTDVCKKTSFVIDLTRGFELAHNSDRPMRLAAKFLFAIDQSMMNG